MQSRLNLIRARYQAENSELVSDRLQEIDRLLQKLLVLVTRGPL